MICLDPSKIPKRNLMYVAVSRVKTPEGLFLLSKIKLFDRIKDNETDLEIKRMLKDNPLKLSLDNFEREHGLVVIYARIQNEHRTYFSWCMLQ